jgi:hypothetical protein
MIKHPPLCRYCGKAIAKRTSTVVFGEAPRSRSGQVEYFTYREERPKSKEEAQRLLNSQVVSVRYDVDYSLPAEERERFVIRATTWDGEHYEDEFFCNGDHARLFGYAAARDKPMLAMPAYHKARARQIAGE